MNLQTWMMKSWPEAPEAASAVLVSTIGMSIALGSLAAGIVVDNVGVAIAIPLAGIFALASGLFVSASRKTMAKAPQTGPIPVEDGEALVEESSKAG